MAVPGMRGITWRAGAGQRSWPDNGPGWVMPRCPAGAEGVAMSDQAPEPGGSGGEADSGPAAAAEDREAAMMRKVMRMQERHREGGVDPDLDDADADAGPEV